MKIKFTFVRMWLFVLALIIFGHLVQNESIAFVGCGIMPIAFAFNIGAILSR